MRKKLAAIVLAATMAVGASLTVCAAPNITDMGAAGTGQEITGDADINLPEIAVTVPTTANIVINPFQMEYEVDSVKHTDQIICAPQEILNESNVAIAVNVSELRVSEASDGITISTAALSSKTTTKSAFLYLQVVGAKEDGTFEFLPYDSKSASQLVIPYVKDDDTKTKKGAKDALVILGAKPDGGDGTKAQFAINGSVVANPTKVDENKNVVSDPWVDTDTLKVVFKFTFTPQIVEQNTGA